MASDADAAAERPGEPAPPAVPVRSGRARVGEIEIAYDVLGEGGRPLVLVMGIGAQRVFWDDALCARFVAAGFHVARFDHRDIGESTRLDAPIPRPSRVARRLVGARVDAPYTPRTWPPTSPASSRRSAGAPRTSSARRSAAWSASTWRSSTRTASARSSRSCRRPAGAATCPSRTRCARCSRRRRGPPRRPASPPSGCSRRSAAPPGPPTARRLRRAGQLAHARGLSPRGFLRHFAAVLASGDRAARLRAVRVPTLVIHGSRDPMFPLRAGRAMTRLMPEATWLPIAGMGHDLPTPSWPTLVAAIARHAERADAPCYGRLTLGP